MFYLYGFDSRSNSHTYLGFRSALVRYSGDSGDLDHLDDDPTSMSGTPDKKARRSPSAESLLGLPTIFPETLADMIRFVIARELTEIYKSAEGVDREKLAIAAYTATEDELKEAVALASILAQLNISTNAMRQAFEQTKLAMTTSITIKKEGDHE